MFPHFENLDCLFFVQHVLIYLLLQIPSQFRVRMYFNEYHGCYYFYISRVNETGKLSVIKFSYFESLNVLELLERFLESWEIYVDSAVTSGEWKLIDYFEGRDPERAFEGHEKDMSKYWENPDLSTENLKIRFSTKRDRNTYTLLLHQPVPHKDTRAYVWHGPVFYINLAGMRTLVQYLREMHRQAMVPPPLETAV